MQPGRCGLAVVAMAWALGAQSTLVLPPSLAATEATSWTNVPFGRTTAMRVQMAYDAVLFPGRVTIDAVTFRLEGGATAAAKTVDLEVRASTLAYGVVGLQSAFDRNRGRDEATVLGRKIVQLAGLSAPSTPSPFHALLAFDQAFTFDPAGGALLLEILVHNQGLGAFPLDATWLCTSPILSFGPAACGGSQALTASVATTPLLWGKPFALQVAGAKPNAVTGFMLGTTESGSWAGHVLPTDLTSFGAPGCWMVTDPAVVSGTVSDAGGVAQLSVFIPSMPALQTQWVRFQGFVLEPTANPLGVLSTQGVKAQICGFDPVGRVYAPGVNPTSGVREVGVAPVVELRTQ